MPFSYKTKRVKTENLISEQQKEFLKLNKNYFSLFLIEANKTNIFGRWEPDFKEFHLIKCSDFPKFWMVVLDKL